MTEDAEEVAEIGEDFMDAFNEVESDTNEESDSVESQEDQTQDSVEVEETNEEKSEVEEQPVDDSEENEETEETEVEEAEETEVNEQPQKDLDLENRVKELEALLAEGKRNEKPAEKEEQQEIDEPEQSAGFKSIDDLTDEMGDEAKQGLNDLFEEFPDLKLLMNKINDNNRFKAPETPKSKEKPQVSEKEQLDLEEGRFWTTLITKRPDAEDISDSASFKNWLKKQSVGVRKMAGSLNVDDAISVLDAYDAAKKRTSDLKKKKEETNNKKKSLKSTLVEGDKKKPSQSSSFNSSEEAEDEFVNAFYED